jgi:hypothetical protein
MRRVERERERSGEREIWRERERERERDAERSGEREETERAREREETLRERETNEIKKKTTEGQYEGAYIWPPVIDGELAVSRQWVDSEPQWIGSTYALLLEAVEEAVQPKRCQTSPLVFLDKDRWSHAGTGVCSQRV